MQQKFPIPEILLGAMLATALFSIGFVFGLSQGQGGKVEEPQTFWQGLIKDPSAAVTAFFTAVLSVSTIFLWRATHKTAQIAERSLTELDRPWLFLAGVRIQRREGPHDPIVPNNFFVSFTWKNVGRSPAIIVDCIVKFAEKSALQPRPDYSNFIELQAEATVGNGESFTTNQIGPGPTSEDTFLVAFGRLRYKELNGKTHSSGFAVEISPHMAAFNRHNNDNYDFYD
jgi:hypothetical protein